jgi:hypothetical protein
MDALCLNKREAHFKTLPLKVVKRSTLLAGLALNDIPA